jgi:hypothetical protein
MTIVKPRRWGAGISCPARRGPLASTSVRAHVARGLVGLVCGGLAIGLAPTLGAVALLGLIGTVIAWRGCPTCWAVGLIGTLEHRRARGSAERSE